MPIFINFSPTSSHQLQVENCDSNSRLVVDEDDNGKFRLERFNHFLVCGWSILKPLPGDYCLQTEAKISVRKPAPRLQVCTDVLSERTHISGHRIEKNEVK